MKKVFFDKQRFADFLRPNETFLPCSNGTERVLHVKAIIVKI